MSSESENFDQLRKLMALKRHEQPPPGYFKSFSGEVIARIKTEQNRPKELSDILKSVPWIMRLLGLMEAKPIFAGAFGVAVCALLIAGIVYSEQMQPTPVATIITPTPSDTSLVSNSTDPLAGRMQMASTTNAAALEAETLFKQLQGGKATPVNYSMPGGF